MKKIEILKLIEANEIIKKNSALLSITRDKRFENISINKEHWFPNIEELKDEFNILEEEIQNALNETNKSRKIIHDSICNHEIRLNYFCAFGNYNTCVLCNKSMASDNLVNWEYSINRNKYCVNLISKHQEDDDGPYDIKNGYTIEQIHEIILKILIDKDENEEIDLVQEFKKLNLQNCTINEEKKVTENYILIIEGTNKQYIDNDSYITKKSLNIGIEFVKYFSALINNKVELMNNNETQENDELKKLFINNNHNLKFVSYNTTEELIKKLHEEIAIPFKIIIDLSELYEYKLDNNSISKEEFNINLNKIFPNSYIIRIKEYTKKSLEELSQFLKNYQKINNVYAYKNNNYYYFDENEIKSKNLDDTCNKIKRMLKK